MDAISLNAVQMQGPAVSLAKKVDDATVKPTTVSADNQNAANEANSYNKYDTMELSREYVGYRMKSENATVNSDTEQLNSTVDQKSNKIPTDEEEETPEKKQTKTQNTEDDKNEDDSVPSNQLGGYTSSELKGLVLSGKITMATYNAEVKSRQDNEPKPVEQNIPNIPNALNTLNTPKNVIGMLNKRAANSIF